MSIVNYIVAASNLLAIPFANRISNSSKYLLYAAASASTIYHLAETKHSLVGVYPFNKYSNVLLNVDRIFAILSFLYVLQRIYKKPKLLTRNMLIIGSIGVMCMWFSERDQIQHLFNEPKWYLYVSKMDFMISHIIWHVSAFAVMSYTLN
jgi:hypothetical protein